MKFKDIKPGDFVLCPKVVIYGFNKKSFYLKEEVVRVTKTQLITSNGYKFRKEDGKEIGRYCYYCCNNNDKLFGEEVKDETLEYEEFLKKLKIGRVLENAIHDLNRTSINYDIPIEELKDVYEKIKEVKKILGGKDE